MSIWECPKCGHDRVVVDKRCVLYPSEDKVRCLGCGSCGKRYDFQPPRKMHEEGQDGKIA